MSFRLTLLLPLLTLPLIACGAQATHVDDRMASDVRPVTVVAAPAAPAVPNPPTNPQTAMRGASRKVLTLNALRTVAREQLGASSFGIVDADQLRGHALGAVFTESLLWSHVFRYCDVSPKDHVAFAWLAGRSTSPDDKFMLVLQHKASREQVESCFAGGGRRDVGGGVLARRVRSRASVTLFAPMPQLLIISSADAARDLNDALSRFTGHISLPPNHPALVAESDQPSVGLAPLNLGVPETIGTSQLHVTLDEDGAKLLLQGDSTSPPQAQSDADALNEMLRQWSTRAVGGKPGALMFATALVPSFEAKGTRVSASSKLSPLKIRLIRPFLTKAFRGGGAMSRRSRRGWWPGATPTPNKPAPTPNKPAPQP